MDWVFLIQKEGEKIWQPIPSPTLEIEEARYRIIGQTNVTNLCVEVRVNVQPLDPSFSTEYRQTKFRRTNSQGLIIILPFTDLKAGLWELSCCSDAMSELMGESWRVLQQIYVMPKARFFMPSGVVEETEAEEPPKLFISKTTNQILPPKLQSTSSRPTRKSPQLPPLPR